MFYLFVGSYLGSKLAILLFEIESKAAFFRVITFLIVYNLGSLRNYPHHFVRQEGWDNQLVSKRVDLECLLLKWGLKRNNFKRGLEGCVAIKVFRQTLANCVNVGAN